MLPSEVPVRLRQIPGGTFWMGSRDGYHDQMSRQLVDIPTCFYSKSRITGRRRIQGCSRAESLVAHASIGDDASWLMSVLNQYPPPRGWE
jgi:hypothetical protein